MKRESVNIRHSKKSMSASILRSENSEHWYQRSEGNGPREQAKMQVPEVAAVCRWCGAPASVSQYLTEWYCNGCRYTIGECRCDRRSPPVAPERAAIIPLHLWKGRV